MSPKIDSKTRQELDAKALVIAVRQALADVREQVSKDIADASAGSAAEVGQVRIALDSAILSVGRLEGEVDRVREDARNVRADVLQTLDAQITAIQAHVRSEADGIEEFRELTAEQIGAFGQTLADADAATQAHITRTVSLVDAARNDAAAADGVLHAHLKAEIEQVSRDLVDVLESIPDGIDSEWKYGIDGTLKALTDGLAARAAASAEAESRLNITDQRLEKFIESLGAAVKDIGALQAADESKLTTEDVDRIAALAVNPTVSKQHALGEQVEGLKSIARGFDATLTGISETVRDAAQWREDMSKWRVDVNRSTTETKEGLETLTTQFAASLKSRDVGLQNLGEELLTEIDTRITAATDAQTERRDATDQRVDTVAGMATESNEVLAKTLAELRAAQDAFDTQVDDALQDLRERVSNTDTDFEAFRTELRSLIASQEEVGRAALEASLRGVETRVAADIVTGIQNARPWTCGGPAYAANAFARHYNGIWQARSTTTMEPGDGEDWVCVLCGVKDTHGTVDADGVSFSLKTTLSNGEFSTLHTRGFKPNMLGTWSAEETYKLWDVVTRNSTRYIALIRNPKGDPATSSDWGVFALRGLKGRKGDKGDPPSLGEITKAIETVLGEIPGIPLRSFRGTWTYQEQFYRGDLVVYDNAIVIAVNDNDGMVAPGIMLGAGFNSDWRILYKISTPSLPRNAVKMDLDYVVGKAVEAYTQVAINGWLMISNTPTSDGAEPYPTTDWSWAVYDGAVDPTWTAASTNAVQLLTGVRIKDARALEVADVRAWIPFVDPDVRYFIMAVSNEENDNPSFAPIFPVSTGWYNLTTGLPRLYETGLEVDLYLVTQGQGSSNLQFTGEWDYRNIGANPNPVNGPEQGDFKQYGTNAPDTAYWSVFDRDLTDRSADMATLVAGDEVSFEWSNPINTPGTTSWVLLENPVYYDNGDVGEGRGPFYDTKLSPPDVPPSGEQSWRDFTITHYLDRPTSYVRIPGNFTGNTIVRGLFSTTGLSNVAETDDSYGIDVYFRPWAKSDDWTVLSMPS